MKRCVFIQGGLGNQMFGYAFFLLLKRVYPQTEVSIYFFSNHNDHNGLELPRIFPIQLTEYRRARARLYWKLYYTSLRSTFIGRGCKLMLLFLRYLNLGLCIEPASRHTRAALGSDYIFNKKYKMYLGYWTSEFQRFTSIEDEIRKHFSFKVEMLSPQSTLLWTELKEEPNSVSLHIRRGDYLNNPQLLDICDDTYYCKACSIINKQAERRPFLRLL